jgi:hypothetical protein
MDSVSPFVSEQYMTIIYYSLFIALLSILLLASTFSHLLRLERRLVGIIKSAPSRAFGRKSLEVTELYVYPVKSCRGFKVDHTLLRMQGLDLDRRWMFVDAETGKFRTIRESSKMTQIQPAISADGGSLELRIAAPGYGDHEANSVSIPARPSDDWLATNTTLSSVEIWKAETDGYLYGPAINEPFSRFLGQPVCLVYKGPTPRILRGNSKPEILGRTQDTYFPDGHPITVASEASLTELNSRLEAKGVTDIDLPMKMERFRPNIIVKGSAPWTEDSWKLVRFRAPDHTEPSQPLDIDITGHCTRCLIPNVDPETAEKHRTEPWNTLMSYRRVDPKNKFKPCFGVTGVPRSEGVIEVGMKMEVLALEDRNAPGGNT